MTDDLSSSRSQFQYKAPNYMRTFRTAAVKMRWPARPNAVSYNICVAGSKRAESGKLWLMTDRAADATGFVWGPGQRTKTGRESERGSLSFVRIDLHCKTAKHDDGRL